MQQRMFAGETDCVLHGPRGVLTRVRNAAVDTVHDASGLYDWAFRSGTLVYSINMVNPRLGPLSKG